MLLYFPSGIIISALLLIRAIPELELNIAQFSLGIFTIISAVSISSPFLFLISVIIYRKSKHKPSFIINMLFSGIALTILLFHYQDLMSLFNLDGHQEDISKESPKRMERRINSES